EEAGTLYYYVVATSSIGNSSSGVTSDTAEVIVNAQEGQEGQEQADSQEESSEESQEAANAENQG
ncbi:MAG TPA: hypothetical protein H9935_04260, partial [Candidatus Blautia merdigallinarum]|nr:hypothetical protein [Candidatus Blautia merdigallinarum]